MAERNEENRLNCPTFEFFAEAKELAPEGLARISKLLDRLAKYGSIRNTDLFKSLEGSEPLFEFRDVPCGCRLICFQSPRGEWITTNGQIKKRWKLNDAAVKTAKQMMESYLIALTTNQIIHESE